MSLEVFNGHLTTLQYLSFTFGIVCTVISTLMPRYYDNIKEKLKVSERKKAIEKLRINDVSHNRLKELILIHQVVLFYGIIATLGSIVIFINGKIINCVGIFCTIYFFMFILFSLIYTLLVYRHCLHLYKIGY